MKAQSVAGTDRVQTAISVPSVKASGPSVSSAPAPSSTTSGTQTGTAWQPLNSMAMYAPARSLSGWVYDPLSSRDPRMIPHLRDYSGDSIQLDVSMPGQYVPASKKSYAVVDLAPRLPFWPTFGNLRASQYRKMSDAEVLIRAWRPKQVRARDLQAAWGWEPLRYCAPVYVAIPGFGAASASHVRAINLINAAAPPHPILVYAVYKYLPFGASAIEEFAGAFWEVFVTWCKPMKWAISRMPSAAAGQTDATIVTDEGTEFNLPLPVVRAWDDPRIRVARNVLMRDYPFIQSLFGIVPVQPPPEAILAIAQYATQLAQTNQAVQGGNGVVSVVQNIPGAPANYPNAVRIRVVPTPQQQQQTQQQQEGDNNTNNNETEDSTPTDEAKSTTPVSPAQTTPTQQ